MLSHPHLSCARQHLNVKKKQKQKSSSPVGLNLKVELQKNRREEKRREEKRRELIEIPNMFCLCSDEITVFVLVLIIKGEELTSNRKKQNVKRPTNSLLLYCYITHWKKVKGPVCKI